MLNLSLCRSYYAYGFSLLRLGFDDTKAFPDSKGHGANMWHTWGLQDPGGPHGDHVDLAILVVVRCISA